MGISKDEDAANRRAIIDAALHCLSSDNSISVMWSKEHKSAKSAKGKDGKGLPALELRDRLIPHSPEVHAKIEEVLYPNGKKLDAAQSAHSDPVHRRLEDLAKELRSCENLLKTVAKERDGLKQECEQLKDEVRNLKEERGKLQSKHKDRTN